MPSTRALEHYGVYVHHFLLGGGGHLEELTHYLSACPNVTNLGIWNIVNPKLLPLITKLPLTQLSINIEAVFGSVRRFWEICQRSHSLLINLTHLDIINMFGEWEKWSGLAHLPHLRYLSMGATGQPERLINGILEHCRKLHVLALLRGGDGSGVPEVKVWTRSERRLVVCEVADFALDWRAGARGDFHKWRYAERALAAVDVIGNALDNNRIAWDSVDASQRDRSMTRRLTASAQ